MALPATSPSLKRPYERNLPEPDSKKNASEPFDLYPLFATIQSAVCFDSNAEDLPAIDIANMLPQMDTSVLTAFNHVLIGKIREQFTLFLAQAETDVRSGRKILGVLSELYQISLVNSSTKMSLAQTTMELRGLREVYKPNFREEMLAAVREGEDLLNALQTGDDVQHSSATLHRMDAVLQKLNPYRELRQYLSPIENQRMRDLAIAVRDRGEAVQYPAVISDYPAIVRQIEQLTGELQLVSQTVKRLTESKLDMHKRIASSIPRIGTVNPLQTRFLDAHASPFYEAFGWHFWNLLWNSTHDKEVGGCLKQLPAWKNAELERVDYSLLNAVWERFLPQFSIEDWMLLSLASIETHQLDTFESQLQAFSKSCTEVQESHAIENGIKVQMVQSIRKEMYELCLSATEPSFSTLSELRKFLNP